jgi:hypothetical protein
MKLNENLEFTQTALLAMAVKPMPAEPCVILSLETELTPNIAQVLSCEDAVFGAEGVPRSGVKSLDLDASIDECRVTFYSAKEDGQTIICHPEALSHMKVVCEDGNTRLRLRAKIAGYATAFCDLINETHDGRFRLKLEPNQIALDFSGGDTRADEPIVQAADEDFLESLGIGAQEAEAEPVVEMEVTPPAEPAPPKRRKAKA